MMKKILTTLLCAIFTFSCLVFGGCNDESQDSLTLYAPDGAPALSVARLLDDKNIENISEGTFIISLFITSIFPVKKEKSIQVHTKRLGQRRLKKEKLLGE